MKIRIYQINLERDLDQAAFVGLGAIAEEEKTPVIDASAYDLVYDSLLRADDLEDVYRIFNTEIPEDFEGRSMSVSDVVEVVESETVEPGYYYCDSIGFKSVEFDRDKASPAVAKTATVVMCEPGRKAYLAEIKTDLSSLQQIIEGFVEYYCPFENGAAIICNDEGKFNGSLPCRAIYDDQKNLSDIIFGRFFICDVENGEIVSLKEEKQKQYLEEFALPEYFFKVGESIQAVKYKPGMSAREREA